jgi:O-methyltransferase
MANFVVRELKRLYNRRVLRQVYRKYEDHTMIPEATYVRNLLLAKRVRHVEGCVVECGVWRGGMIAGLADLLGDQREYYLFDSFEGLPTATRIDGPALRTWQANVTAPGYHNNCTAAAAQAEAAMKQSAATRYFIVKGWFEDTVPAFHPSQKIALLRLDGDLYDSTIVCLKYLYPQVADEGIIIVDDYQPWDGCARAVHEFLAQLVDAGDSPRLLQYDNDVIFLDKRTRDQVDSALLQSTRDGVSSGPSHLLSHRGRDERPRSPGA